ncbi:MAG: hypothetical protein HRU12_14170 [Phaeodactylibacter sp.]|nr:hypothetical protein [Phaeodactylibacter sp.]
MKDYNSSFEVKMTSDDEYLQGFIEISVFQKLMDLNFLHNLQLEMLFAQTKWMKTKSPGHRANNALEREN